MRLALPLLLAALIVAGCEDSTSPHSAPRPAAPRGLYSTTGDHEVLLQWLSNTEPDVTGYRVYIGDCPDVGCTYTQVGATSGVSYLVTGLADGVKRYFAVTAVNRDGRESDLSYEDVNDTPRPEGHFTLTSVQVDSTRSGWDFSTFSRVSSRSPNVDVVFSDDGVTYLMYCPYPVDTDIQDAGFGTSLDAVDVAPTQGWSPTHSVELIPGHCYVVWTHGDHYGKFRVTSIDPVTGVSADWAYQTDAGNTQLHARRPVEEGRGPMRTDLPLPAKPRLTLMTKR